MAKRKAAEENLGALVFWLVLVATAIVPLLWLQVWSYQSGNMKGFIVGNLFVGFIVMTFALDFQKRLYPSRSTFTQNCFSFAIGIGVGSLLGFLSSIGQQSIFSLFTVSQQYLLSEITSQLPLFWATFANTFGAPVAEELLFLISIPTILFIILEFASKKIEVLKNALIQIAIVGGVVGPLFAFFHVGNIALVGFIISAIFFRVLVIGIVHGEEKADILPAISIIPAFGVGYHIANNVMYSGGWTFFFQVMLLEPFGFVVLFMISVFLAGAFWHVAGPRIRKVRK